MIYKIADNVLSPIGETTAENYQAVKAGRSALCRYDHHWGLPDSFTASLFTTAQTQRLQVDGLTRFESLAVRSASDAIQRSGIDVAHPRVIFILSSTKGNIELLADGGDVSMGNAARRIAQRLGFLTEPLVVCNACISGVSAIIAALRLLEADCYDYAVVCGADVQSPFTVSGFQSLKAVAEDACRPFDIERTGLNLGEGAATIVFGKSPIIPHPSSLSTYPSSITYHWAVVKGAIRNDAYHVSTPSKDGEGARRALQHILKCVNSSDIAFINAHGTATMYNDQMESKAIERAGLSAVPVNALKGYFGHTLGAAGVLETIISMAAMDDHTIIGTRGFKEIGVSGKIGLSPHHQPTDKQCFVKMISGFGGGNAALLLKSTTDPSLMGGELHHTSCIIHHTSYILHLTSHTSLTDLYKENIGDYPRFYKMDGLSRLGFVASELLLQKVSIDGHCAIILFNRSSSIDADRKYQTTIAADDYFPSPSVFVYTLPNIVTGEMAIRHQWHSETSFYILPERDDAFIQQMAEASLADKETEYVLTGWLDYEDDTHYEAQLSLIVKSE